MYARVAVASDALSTTGLPIPAANLIHRTLLEHVNAHGRLIFGDDPEVTALLRAIKSGEGIPQDARTRWVETLTRLRKYGRIKVLHTHQSPLSDARVLDDLRANWGTVADVAIVASDACQALGIPPDVGVISLPGKTPDVAITAAASSSPVMQRLKALADNAIAPTGSDREDFWQHVLAPLASDARSVTILDGYLFKPLWDIRTQKPWARAWRTEHVAWLLEHLDSVMAPQAQVRLIGNRHNDYPQMTANDTAEALREHWKPLHIGRLQSITLLLANPRRGERFPHDRHIRFSNGSAIEISAGLDRLRQDTIWDPDGMKWKYVWHNDALRALQYTEERGASYARHQAVQILQR